MSINRSIADVLRNHATIQTAAPDFTDFDVATDNLIINGNHVVHQRGASFTSVGATDSERLTDMWKVRSISSASARWTVTREVGGGLSREDPWMKIVNTTADASPGADETQWIVQDVEGNNMTSIIADDNTVKAMTVSLDIIAHADSSSSISFPAKVAIGVDLPQGASRQIVNDVTVTAADTWQRVSFTLPADSFTGWGALTTANLSLNVVLYGGSNRVCTANTWAAIARDTVTSNTSNWADATDNYIGFTNVQVNPGTANTFRRESYSSQAVKCRRYFWAFSDVDVGDLLGIGMATSTTAARMTIPNPVPMRAAPTLTATAADFKAVYSGGSTALTAIATYATPDPSLVCGFSLTTSGSLTGGDAIQLQGNGADKKLWLSAEL